VLTDDEWFMLRNHNEGPAWIIHQARTFEPHPLLYYLGFWAWVGLTGSTEWAMRYPSALFGVLACLATWRLVRDAVGPGVAIGAALLLALNPYQVAQSQNARNYAMVAALATVATCALLIAARRGGSAAWWRYAVAMLLALHTHLNAVLVAGAHGVWLVARALVRRERPEPAALRAFALVLILFVPWIAYAWPALTAYQGFYPEKVGFVEVIQRSLATFAFGQIETPRRALVALVGGLIALASLWAAWRFFRARDEGPALVALTGALPIGLMAAVFLVRPMFEERYLIVAAPASVALLAIGAALLGKPAPAVGLAALGWLTLLTTPFLQRYYPAVAEARPDWRGLAAWVAQSERPGDVALITGHGIADAYGYYRRAQAPIVLAADPDTARSDVDALLARGPAGAFLLPYWESPPDVIAHDRLTAVGFPEQTRWFRGQRAQYVALPSPTPSASRPIGATWREAIELTSGAVGPASAARGDAVRVELSWRALTAAPDLKISLRLLRESGETVVQLDRRPVDEARPFTTIKPGEAVRDGHALRVPPDLAPGRYLVALLLYQPDDAKAVTPSVARELRAPGSEDLVLVDAVTISP
jgi:4-amino-4-deoxy-L-arabinose transferase-like glycosyltransferase